MDLRAVVLAAALAVSAPALAEEPAGDWGGLLLGKIHVVFHIERGPDGRYQATGESPDQTAALLPVDKVDAGPDHLDLTLSSIGARYTAKWDEGQKAWVGSLDQRGPAPLVLHRLTPGELAALRPRRRQDEAAAAAFPSFRPEEVAIANPEAPGVKLAGTFSKPAGAGPFPAVVLVAGSGQQTRDEEVGRHRTFLVLAAELNRRGLAVLRYDKRGVGGSSGDGKTATGADFASDALAAFRYLVGRPDVDARRSGVVGHSEGGMIAPLVANQEPRVAYIVLMAGPGQRGAELLAEQQRLVALAGGASERRVAQLVSANRAAFDAVLAASDATDAAQRIKALPGGGKGGVGDAVSLTEPWMFNFLRYDPRPALERLRTPVLAVTGSLDLQVPAKDNLPIMRAALAGNPDTTVRELPGLNHLFQTAKTGGPAEYGQIEETLSPLALTTIGDWLAAHAGSPTAKTSGVAR